MAKKVKDEVERLAASLRSLRRDPRAVIGQEGARMIWYSMFDPTVLHSSRRSSVTEDSRIIMERIFERFPKRLEQGKTGDWKYLKPASMLFSELERNPSLLSMAPEKPLVVTIAMSGIPTGSVIWNALRIARKSPGYALVSCLNYGDHRFIDGSSARGRCYVPDEHIGYLRRNRERPAIIVDSVILRGSSISAVGEKLQEIGFRKIFFTTLDLKTIGIVPWSRGLPGHAEKES